MNPDHERIWLAPRGGGWDDRAWCGENCWADIPECADDPPTEYLRADLVTAKDAEIARLRLYITGALDEIEGEDYDGASIILHNALGGTP